MSKHKLTLEFELGEYVSEDLFTQKVAKALMTDGVLREGESVTWKLIRKNSERVGGRMKDVTIRHRYTHDGWYRTSMGGMLRQEIEVPDIRIEELREVAL